MEDKRISIKQNNFQQIAKTDLQNFAVGNSSTTEGVFVTPACAATILLGTVAFAGALAFWILPDLLVLLGFAGSNFECSSLINFSILVCLAIAQCDEHLI